MIIQHANLVKFIFLNLLSLNLSFAQLNVALSWDTKMSFVVKLEMAWVVCSRNIWRPKLDVALCSSLKGIGANTSVNLFSSPRHLIWSTLPRINKWHKSWGGCSLVMSALALVPVLVLTVLPHWHWQYGHPVLLWCLNWTVNTKCSLHKADSWMSDNDEGGFCDKKLRLACGNRWGLLAQLATRSREQTKVSFNFIWEFPQSWLKETPLSWWMKSGVAEKSG